MTRDDRFTRSSSEVASGSPGDFDILSFDTLSDVTLDDEEMTAEFDPESHDSTIAIIEAVSTAGFLDPLDLTPLSYRIDPDALEDLLARSPATGRIRIQFTYEGFVVTVSNDGEIRVRPVND